MLSYPRSGVRICQSTILYTMNIAYPHSGRHCDISLPNIESGRAKCLAPPQLRRPTFFAGGAPSRPKQQQTSVSSFRSIPLLATYCFVQDEGAISFAGAIARHKQSLQLCAIDCPGPFAMPSLHRCRVAHTVHQWHKDRHVDKQPENTTAEEVAVCSSTSVGATQ